ncbi:hypothetical protein FQN50_003044 [Emmonsiellopsis sp. PD_5]|nr:hypothetical protein FQN50_003044 [Emmonsiellopsis sp. PD_5]
MGLKRKDQSGVPKGAQQNGSGKGDKKKKGHQLKFNKKKSKNNTNNHNNNILPQAAIVIPPSTTRKMSTTAMAAIPKVAEHLALIENDDRFASSDEDENVARMEEIRTTPLFSSGVKMTLQHHGQDDILPQYALMGMRTETYGRVDGEGMTESHFRRSTNLVYANVNAPWSTFICGSQGSGKSHTLSCMLENSLLQPSCTGNVSSPLTGLVLHYDKFTGIETGQLCEAAYLSTKIPVRVLVSPSNYARMAELYANLPGLPEGASPPKVSRMYFREDQMTIGMMKDLMAVSGNGTTPLYMEVVTKVLREMAEENQGRRGINFQLFRSRLREARFTKDQNGPLEMRLQLLESFLQKPGTTVVRGKNRYAMPEGNVWDFPKGSLTIIDLSCPFVDENDACSLFNIGLSIFMERRSESGRVVALDEAHKFLTTNSREAINLTDSLLSIVRQQRHLATRVIIATQEPTLSLSLLDLCNVTIVHRFTSPAWYKTLRGHLAGAVFDSESTYTSDGLFSRIVTLRTGEALVFCPSAMLDLAREKDDEVSSVGTETAVTSTLRPLQVKELGARYARIRIRKRVTTDGGRSILADG